MSAMYLIRASEARKARAAAYDAKTPAGKVLHWALSPARVIIKALKLVATMLGGGLLITAMGTVGALALGASLAVAGLLLSVVGMPF